MLLTLIATSVLAQGRSFPIEWSTYEPKGLNFSVEIPGKGSPVDQQITDRNVRSKLLGTYLLNKFSGFVVVYCDLPTDANAETFLPDAWEKHISTQKYAEVIQKQFTTWQGKPCFEGTYKLGNRAAGRIRLVVSKNRLIQQLATWTEESYDKPSVERFFASFKFTSSTIPTARIETYRPALAH